MKWHNRFIMMANLVASWSKDPSSKVGAVIADKDNRIISLGYNGPAHSVDDTYFSHEYKQYATIHAEINAILFAKQIPPKSKLYCTHFCCAQCASVIAQTREISEIYIEYPRGAVADYTRRWHENIMVAFKMIQHLVSINFVGSIDELDCKSPLQILESFGEQNGNH